MNSIICNWNSCCTLLQGGSFSWLCSGDEWLTSTLQISRNSDEFSLVFCSALSSVVSDICRITKPGSKIFVFQINLIWCPDFNQENIWEWNDHNDYAINHALITKYQVWYNKFQRISDCEMYSFRILLFTFLNIIIIHIS